MSGNLKPTSVSMMGKVKDNSTLDLDLISSRG